MTGSTLHRRLSSVAGRVHRVRTLRHQTLAWLIVIIPAVLLCVMLPVSGLPLRRESIALLTAGTTGLLLARWKSRVPTWLETARLVEQHHPELNDIVLTAVRQQSSESGAGSVLGARVLREADQVALVADWHAVAPSGQIIKWFAASLLTFGLLVSSVFAAGRMRTSAALEQNAQADARTSAAVSTLVTVDPGDTEVERGTGLTVVAQFDGERPTQAVVEYRPDVSEAPDSEESPIDQQGDTFEMTETVDAGVFAIRIPQIRQDGTYVVYYGYDETSLAARQHSSKSYQITTYERPRVVQVDAEITPPAWTGRGESTVEDTLKLTAIEGSTIRLKLHLNKPVAVSQLKSKSGAPVDLTCTELMLAEVSATVLADEVWTVLLEDHDGRTSDDETTISLRIIHNEPPEIRITFPQPDLSVSALQELVTDAEAADDFGILDYGIVYSLSGSDSQTVSLRQDETPDRQATMTHMIDLESLAAEPDDLLTWHFFADTYNSAGEVQRSRSDLMFADIRRFEEIFRESQQPGGAPQSGQPQSQSESLLQIQRQIAIAIWNIQRSHSGGRQSTADTQLTNVETVVESQQVAISQLEELKQRATDDPELAEAVNDASLSMNEVVDSLSQWSADTPEPALTDASAASQAAFRALLRLRSVEHRIQRSQNQQGRGSGQQNSSMQKQLDQLELDNDRNRYETEQQAQQHQQTEEQQEQLQVLSRLKDLARRQNMLNERLKQLESELRLAKTEEEQERLERELKRLRDEQRELLRDVDELKQRMDQSRSSSKPEQQYIRDEVEQARENVRQASQAMGAGELSKALSEGTRAERQFDQLQEEFRNQTSSAFTEAARDLRQQARKLSEQQDEIARKLSGAEQSDGDQDRKPTGPTSLRFEKKGEEIQEKLGQQRDDLDRILNQSKELIEQAETSEPLLARQLYETLQDVEELRPAEALRTAELLVDRGLWRQVHEPERAAGRAIETLRQGVESAAEAVLGSEAESLKRAEQTLEQLANELSDEVTSATGQQSPDESRTPTDSSSSRSNEQQARNQSDSQQQPQSSGESQQETNDSQSPAQTGQPARSNSKQSSSSQQQGSILQGGGRLEPRQAGSRHRPLTGTDFRNWSDRLREVEELLDNPELRHRATKIRDRARAMRAEFRRHGTEPQWDLVESGLLEEMSKLQRRIRQDISALTSDRSLVPIDREPVPEIFDQLVQEYYEQLGHEHPEPTP